MLPGKTRIATGQPVGIGQQPVLDLELSALGVAGVTEGAEGTVPPLHPRRGQVEVGATGRVGPGERWRLASNASIASWRDKSQSIAA